MQPIDFSSIPSMLDPSVVVAALLALGVVYATVDFVMWAVRQVGGFFDWVEWYRYGDMDHDEHWDTQYGRMNSVLNKVGLGR